MSQRVLAAIAVRLGFLFLAIGLPGLVVTIVKRLIGRARPLVEGSADPFIYRPLGWSVEYASLPSGHATMPSRPRSRSARCGRGRGRCCGPMPSSSR